MSAVISSPPGPIDLPRLQAAVRAVDPAALLLPRRLLCRVIKKHHGLGGLGLGVPHRKSYLIDRQTLLSLVTAAELGADPQALPDAVLLVQQPELFGLDRVPAEFVLRDAWRLLFHLKVHQELRRLRQAGRFGPELARAGIRRLGPTAFEEAREVLRMENFLFDGDDLPAVWEEFTAVFLEMHHFDPHRLRQYFPAVEDPREAYRLLTEEIDAADLFHRTRPDGAALPGPEPAEPPPEAAAAPAAAEATSTAPGVLRRRAEAMARRGNLVRAAIFRLRAVPQAPPSQAGVLRAEARRDVEAVVARLQPALGFPAAERGDWARCLAAVAEEAARGVWSPGSRLLYDLQKVCTDLERPAFAADLVEWTVSWFQRPIKRLLPDLPVVLAVKHLRQARARLPVVPLHPDVRRRLDELTAAAEAAAEARLRRVLRPKLVAGLDAVGLVPANAAECLSRDKLVEEWLDQITERSYLALGDLRDGLARNQLKLPDLGGPVTFFTGDPLIRLNRDLAVRLDGIYHRGEIYLRWLQRFSSLFFGTAVGRLLSLYVILPLLGSFFLLKGIDALSEELHKFFGTPELHTFHPVSFAALAVFILPMLHAPPFRRAVLLALTYAWRAVRWVAIDLPAAALHLRVVRFALQSRAYLAFYQYAGKPIAWTVPAGCVLLLFGAGWPTTLAACAAAAVAVSLLLNSRAGLYVEETAADWLTQTWRLVREDLLPGAFRWVIWVSHALLERVDKLLYRVDEWLRFRQGDNRFSLLFKLSFGLIWFVITYVVRLVVNLFVEPQINPVKHFPVVTVSHKLMLVIADPVAHFVAGWLGVTVHRAYGYVVGFLGLIPGVFGFLAWELKENWRLYRANRSPTIDPEVVGGHGEKVINLLRPGFHSGTLPRLFARTRAAKGSSERKYEASLHHVEGEVRRFVERDLIAVVRAGRAWPAEAGLAAGAIHLATNQIRIELRCPGVHAGAAVIELACRGGWLVGGVTEAGFLAHLAAQPRRTALQALSGFFKWCGVDFLSEQLAAAVPPPGDFDLSRDRLVVYLDAAHSRAVAYHLDAPEKRVEVPAGFDLPDRAAPLMFSRQPLTWATWVACWEADRAAGGEGGRSC